MFSQDADAAVTSAAVAETAGQWLVRAQDGQAAAVVAEIRTALRTDLEPSVRVRALYAQTIALLGLSRPAEAREACRDLVSLCRDLGLTVFGVRATALYVHVLRRVGDTREAAEQLARAAALEHALDDLHDPDVQAALGALAVALRLSGVSEEALRIEERLEQVEAELPRDQRVSRWSNLAFGHAVAALTAARRAPFGVDGTLLAQAVREIEKARGIGGITSYDIVGAEAAVLSAVLEAFCGDAAIGLRRLEACSAVLEEGPEANTAQLFWGAGVVRAMVRLGRPAEAARRGRQVLELVAGSGLEGDRLILAYETMRAEYPGTEFPGSGTAEFVELSQQRLGQDLALVGELFRARVDLLRGADERRTLQRAAELDSLTGLVNRRGAGAALQHAANRPLGEPVALLLIDLDGFKDVNDTRGHLAGDVVLQRVAAALRTAARLDDVVARWGGDEFIVIASLDSDRALALAGRLRETIREHSRQVATTRVSGSIGVAVRNAPIDEHIWLNRADEAMYSAKRSGGDAAVIG